MNNESIFSRTQMSFFSGRILRILFQNEQGRICWIDYNSDESIYPMTISVEEWRIENNLPVDPTDWSKEDWTMFKMRWL